MKKIYFFIMAMFLAVMPLVFVSCSDDEEEKTKIVVTVWDSDGMVQENVKVYCWIGNKIDGSEDDSQTTNSKGIATFDVTDDVAGGTSSFTFAVFPENNKEKKPIANVTLEQVQKGKTTPLMLTLNDTDDEAKEAILNVKLVSEGENEVKYARVYLYKNLTGEPTTENNQYEAATNDEGIVKFEFDKDDFTTEVTMTAVVFGEEEYYSAQTTLKIGETKTITITIP